MVQRRVKNPAPLPEISSAHVRRWAESKGIQIKPHGRVPKKIMELYLQRDRADVTDLVETLSHKGQEVTEIDPLMKPTGKRSRKHHPCGFCSTTFQTPRHELCPITVRNADATQPDRVWHCPCAEKHPELHPQMTRG